MTQSKFWAKVEKRFPRFSGWLDRRYRKRGRTFALFMVLAHLIGAATSVQAIMETRTSQGAVAWAISLNAIPLVAVPAYWVFGRSEFQGYVTERRTELAKVQPTWIQSSTSKEFYQRADAPLIQQCTPPCVPRQPNSYLGATLC